MQEKKKAYSMTGAPASRRIAAKSGKGPLGLTILKTDRGVALVTVLILSAICLLVMTSLLYMVMTGTQVSGMAKNYKTALEAGLGGKDIVQQFLDLRGDQITTEALVTKLNNFPNNLSSKVTTSTACSGVSNGVTYSWITAKMMSGATNSLGTSNWTPACDKSITIIPTDESTYDLKLELGTDTKYTVYAKIVDTVDGNSGGGEGLLRSGVVSNSGDVPVMSMPYLYTIEIDAQNNNNNTERAKLQVLYQY